MPRGSLVAVAVALAAGLALAGCSSPSRPVATHSADPTATTCARFEKMNDVDRQIVITAMRLTPSATFDASGAKLTDPAARVASECAAKPNSYTVLSADTQQVYPPCPDYLALGTDIQQSWALVYYQVHDFGGTKPLPPDQAESLVVGCSTDVVQSPTIDDAGRDVFRFLSTHPNPADFAEYLSGQGANVPTTPSTPTNPHSINWTTTDSLGYTTASMVTWGTVGRGTNSTTHPSDKSFKLGAACGFDPTKDAYAPATWTVQNTTKGYDLVLQSQFSVQGGITTPGVSVAVELDYNNGPACGFSNLPYAGSVTSTKAIASGQSIATQVFIIVKNYFSPANPNGDVIDLGKIQVQQSFIGGGSKAPLG